MKNRFSEPTKCMRAFRRCAFGLVTFVLAATAARGQEPAVPAPLQPAISDVEWLTGEPAGTRIVQFKLDGPKGLKFFVWWSHSGPARGGLDGAGVGKIE